MVKDVLIFYNLDFNTSYVSFYMKNSNHMKGKNN